MDFRLLLLLTCFFLSGFAALLYQTAWTRELSFVFGTSELAVAAVLAAYMGGLALGAAAAARYAQRLRRPVLVYGVLELAIAVSALSVPAAIHWIHALYSWLLGGGGELPDAASALTALFQLGAAFAVLLPPTAFMGATLPLLARHAVRSEEEIGSRVGLLYAVNTAGAIAGTLCAAFWLMPELGLRRTVWTGAGLNGLVFALAALLARGAALPPAAAGAAPAAAVGGGRATWVLPAMMLSGAVSFAYEVLWTRLLGHLLGASVQAFATMLGSFLLGIALGSAVASRIATRRERAAAGFGWSQLGIAAASAAAFALADRLPDLSGRLGAGPEDPLASAAVAGAVLLPITLCLGATFPFAVRLLARRPEDAARATARVYSWNTVGAIAGALGAGFVLLPGLGFAGTLSVGVAANLGLAAATALAARPRRKALVALAGAGAAALLILPPGTPWTLLSSSPLTRQPERGEIVYAAVGRSSTVMLFDRGTDFRLSSNGLPESKILRRGMLPTDSVARWLGLLPALLRPGARELLVVGLGGGMAVEPVPSTVAHIDVIELEPEVLEANRRIRALRAIDPLADPRVRVHIGDARGALQLTAKRYDAVVSQPSHPWTAGASHLYTREFFSLVRSRMPPDGVFVQWIGVVFVDEALLRSLVATLADVFAYVEVFHPRPGGLLFAASDAPLGLAAAGPALAAARDDFARFGIDRVEDLAAARVLDAEGARAFSEGATLITDDHNLLATRASRLGDAALDGGSVHRVLRASDSLLAPDEELDFFAVIRRLGDRGASGRATDLALARSGAEEDLALGWTELGRGRAARAARHFERALELEPGSREARAGIVASRPMAFSRPGASPDLGEAPPDPGITAVTAGWRLARTGDWEAIAALDGELARIRPGDALFEEASRLRIHQRLGRPDPEDGAEAVAIAEALLERRWRASDGLLHARAALAAGRPEAARGSLERIAALPPGPRSRDLASQALAIARQLPPDAAGDLVGRLAERAHGRGGAAG